MTELLQPSPARRIPPTIAFVGLKRMAGAAAVALAAASASPGTGEGVSGVFCSAIALDPDGRAPEWIRLFPRGPKIRTVNYDGREFTLSDPEAVAAASMEDGLDLPIDWEHARVHKAETGEKIPTAGWIREMRVRDGVLEGRVKWTADGRASVESEHYKYFSPYFHRDADGEILRVRHGGLVGEPAFVMPALASGQARKERPMKKILAALGLAAGATEEEAAAAAARITAERDEAKAQAARPSLDRFVPRGDYDAAVARAEAAEAKVADSEKAAREAEIKELLDKAQAAGQITPATREFHLESCRAEGGIRRFKAYIAKAPVIAQPTTGLDNPPGGGGGATESAAAKHVAGLFGHTLEFVNKHASPLPEVDA